MFAQAVIGHRHQARHVHAIEEVFVAGIAAPVDVDVPARSQFVHAVDQRLAVLPVDIETRRPVDRVLQRPQHPAIVVAVGLGHALAPGRELAQRGLLVTRVDQYQQVPDQGFLITQIDVLVLVVTGAGERIVGVEVVFVG